MITSVDDLYGSNPRPSPAGLAVVALGANLPGRHGSPAASISAVIPALQALSQTPVVLSSIIETEPEDCPPGSPRFANAVVVLKPLATFTPVSLLLALQAIEADCGRQRKGVKNEARVLDLDLISFGDHCINTDFLTLPHPRARERLFVMQPLAEVWPLFRFPGDKSSAAEQVLLLKSGK